MKGKNNFKKATAIILSILFVLSSFSIVTAANYDKNYTGHNAQIIGSGATLDEALTKASNKINVNGSSSWGLKWKSDYSYTNAVTGAKETLYGNQYINYHTYNYIGSSKKYTCWCIQPYLNINNNGNYKMIDNGGNKAYWNKLSGTDIQKSIAKVIAFGKKKMHEKSSNNNEYYYAVQILAWEFIMGIRGATNYSSEWKSKSRLTFPTTDKANKFLDAYKYILECMNTDVESITDGMYKTMSGASSASKKLLLDYTKEKATYSDTVTVSGIKKGANVKYSIVNNEDKKPQDDKMLTLTVNKNKKTFTVKQSAKASKTLYELKQSGTTYYVKAEIDDVPEYSSSDSNVILQNTNKNSQTLAQSMKFNINPPVRYFAIDAKKDIITEPTTTPEVKYGSFKINKKVETKSGKPYEGDLSGWIFGVEDETNQKKYLLTTNEDGETATINNIPLGHQLHVIEYGKEMPKYYDELEWNYIRTIGSEYGLSKNMTVGMPQRWKEKSGQAVRQTIEEEDLYEFDVTNVYSEEISLHISKVVDDDSPLAGYYFYVFNAGFTNYLLNRPIIVGPTNDKGECEELLTDNSTTGTVGIIELGFLKKGEVIYTKHPSLTDFVNQNWRDKFEIPSKFDKQEGNYSITGFSDAVPFSVSKSDIANHYKDIVFSNTTSGYLEITKKDKSTNAPIKNAVYGLYNKSQPLTDNTSYDDSSSSGGDSSDDITVVDESEGKEDNEDYSDDTSLICTLTTDENGKAISPLIRTGKYILKEISVDKTHYIDDTEYEVEITPGSNTLSTAVKKELKDEPTNINFYKTEKSTLSTNGSNVKGAHIKIYEKPSSGTINYDTAKVITEFDTTTTAKSLKGIFERGKTYIAHETKTPNGYITAADVEFTIPDKKDTSKEKVKMEDGTTNIEVYKKNADSTKNLSGCTLQVKDSNNNVIDSWVTTTSAHKIEGKLVVGKTYTLSETKPAPGYTTAKSISFTVKNTTATQTVTMTDVQTSFEIYKKNANTSKNISGCVLEVRDSNKNVIDSWTTTTSAHKIVGKLVCGQKYTLVETKPAPGYTTAKSIEFTVKDTPDVQTVTMEDVQTLIKVFKKNANNGKNLSGCKLAVKDKNNKLIESWTSTREAHTITGLTVGETYTLYEVEPAPGYTKAENITFKVQDINEAQEVVMNDEQTHIKVYKKNADGTKTVPNCVLAIKDLQGNTITVWKSTDEAYDITGLLSVNQTYILEEREPAAGYTTAQSKSFTVLNIPEPQEVVMNDTTTKVRFTKTEATGTKNLEGCSLILYEEGNRNVIDSWTTTTEPHIIEGKLKVGKTYILEETKPKNGYATAESVRITVQDTDVLQSAPIMKDDTIKVEFSKTDIVTGKEIEGCRLKIIDTTNEEIVEEWTSTTTPHKIEGKLVAGRKYIFSETRPADGYATADNVEFTVLDTGNIQTVEMKDETTKVELSKKKITGDEELVGCELELRDSDNNIIDSWVSSNAPHLIEKLTVGKTYTLTEKHPTDGYVTAEDIKFTVRDTGEVQKITPMRDDTTKVEFSKTDMTGEKELPNCDLQLLDKTDNNKEIAKWTTTNTPHYIEGQLIVGHTYTLIELRPAEGYTTAASIEFTVSDTGNIQKVHMSDGNTKVQFSKTDLTGENELPGCELVLTDETDNNKEIERWTTTNESHIIEGKLIAGHTYVLTEVNPAKGYVTAANVKYIVKDTTELQIVKPMKDDTTKVSISKTDITGEKEVPNCKLKLVDKANDSEVDSWTSTDKPHYIEGKLVIGHTYILSETYPADGYSTAKDVEFTVEDKGTVQKVQMKNQTTKVSITKTDITGEKEIPNCKLEVFDEEGFIVDNWTSTDKPHIIEGKLVAGKTYTLAERKPADGYASANDIKFTVKDTGDIQNITPMKDDTTKYSFSKTDITGTKEIENCKLELTDKTDNKKVDSWISSTKPYYIEGKLIVGHTYVLKESYPADGYTTAADIEFIVSDDGLIHNIPMKDDTTKVQISKTDITGEKELEGCQLELTDATNNKKVDEWVSTTEPHYIEGKLIIGHNYTLKELSPAAGYTTAEEVNFTVKDSSKIQKVIMRDQKTKVNISKQDISNGKEIKGCHLIVTDKETGNIIEEWDSEEKAHIIEGKLIVGVTYILTETKPANGYTTAESIEFTVKDSGEVQTVEMIDDITKVSISKTDITGKSELKGCKLRVYDKETNEEIDSWTSTDKPHNINGELIIGKTYILSETQPTDGYTTAEDIEFTVKDTGDIQKVTMKDAPTTVKIYKFATYDTKHNLKGATLKIYNKNDKKEQYIFKTNANKPNVFIGKLKVNNTYILEEIKAPTGYKIAKSGVFKVKDTAKSQIIKMYDKKIKVTIPTTGGKDENNTLALSIILGTIGLLLMFSGLAIYLRKNKKQL